MKTLKLTSALLIAALAFSSCKKDKNDHINRAQNSREFTQTFGAQLQKSSSFNAAEAKTIVLSGGTALTFAPNSFTINGQAVSGQVVVEAYEMLNRSSILFSGTNTNHISGAPLISQGFIFFDAKVNGVSVDKILAKPVEIVMPANGNSNTIIWEGVENVGDANQMAWQAPANGQQREIKAVGDDFIFNFGQTGWVNCDTYYSISAPKTTVSVTINNNPGEMATFRGYSGETFVFFCAKNDNVVAQIYTANGTNSVKSYDDSMPVGAEGKLLSFSVKDGKYYYAEKEITISADMNETLSLVETSEAAVQTSIDALDNY